MLCEQENESRNGKIEKFLENDLIIYMPSALLTSRIKARGGPT
jgi:hypothetical protein